MVQTQADGINCNEERQYFLKLNAQSNLNGAEVRAAGVALNGNDLGQEFNIAANSCVEDLIINVTQQQGSTELEYPGLEIFLYSLCDPDQISSSVFASVFFGDPSGVKDVRGDDANMTVYPNPTSGILMVQLNDASVIDGYTLRDITGVVVSHTDFKIPVHVAELKMHSVPDGVYILEARSEKQFYAKKVIVQ